MVAGCSTFMRESKLAKELRLRPGREQTMPVPAVTNWIQHTDNCRLLKKGGPGGSGDRLERGSAG